MNRPKVQTVDTVDLVKMVEQVMMERPDFYHKMRKLGEADYEVICRSGFRNAFGTTDSLKSFLIGVTKQEELINELKTNQLELSGDANINEERRRIKVLLRSPSTTEDQQKEFQIRDQFLHNRTKQRHPNGAKSQSRMTLTMLEDEYINKGHIQPRPANGRYPYRSGFRYKCPPSGRKGDIAWALYQKATRAVDRFDGPSVPGGRRVPWVDDEGNAPGSVTKAADPGSGAASTSTTKRQLDAVLKNHEFSVGASVIITKTGVAGKVHEKNHAWITVKVGGEVWKKRKSELTAA